MNTTKDRSHSTNVLNFEALIAHCQSLGARYNPKKDHLKISYLQSRLTSTQALMRALDTAVTADTNARDRRRKLFDKLPSLASRVVGTFSFCDVTDDAVDHAKSLLKKIQGRRIKPLKKAETEGENGGDTTEPEHREANQQSFMFLVQHMQQLIEVISLATDYDPNEIDLKKTALEAYLQQLKDANTETMTTGAAEDKARTDRDRALYRNGDGLVKIAKDIKKYIKIVFGKGSTQSTHANSIFFIDYKFIEQEEAVPDPS